MKNLVLKDKMGRVIRVFRLQAEKAFLVYRKNKGRLDIGSSPDFFEKEPVVILDEFSPGRMTGARSMPFMSGSLELCEKVSSIRAAAPRPAVRDDQSFGKALVLTGAGFAVLIGVLYALSQKASVQAEKPPEQRVVKIIKPIEAVKPQTVVMNSRRMFLKDSKIKAKKKIVKKSLKKLGALAALGSLSRKESSQKGGLNLNPSSKVSAGPGFKASASASGGIQESIYSQGMIASALGAGGNIRGGGGYGTKGSSAGGGRAGYGQLTLIGSGGSEDLSDSSLLDTQGGAFDSSLIDREIVKHIGKIRLCYDQALKEDPNLQGLLKVHFAIKPSGRVAFSRIHKRSPARSQKISSCILDIINKIHFPFELKSVVGVDYAFDLSALEAEGG